MIKSPSVRCINTIDAEVEIKDPFPFDDKVRNWLFLEAFLLFLESYEDKSFILHV